MTAGKGLIHAEISSEGFLENGGGLEILQLWINLPAKYKIVDPIYTGLQKQDIPVVELDHGKATKGAFTPMVDIHLTILFFQRGGAYKTSIPQKGIFSSM